MIRSARPQDAAPIAAVESLIDDGAWTPEQVTQQLCKPGALNLVAVQHEHILGHLLTSVVVDEAEIITLAVHPRARRRGLGAALLADVEDRWRAQGVVQAFLEVRTDNAAAIALYRRAGWQDAGQRRAYYRDGCDALVLRREIGEPPGSG